MVSEEGLPYVGSVRKVYHMCVVSEEGLPYVWSVGKVYHMCVVSGEGLPYVRVSESIVTVHHNQRDGGSRFYQN